MKLLHYGDLLCFVWPLNGVDRGGELIQHSGSLSSIIVLHTISLGLCYKERRGERNVIFHKGSIY